MKDFNHEIQPQEEIFEKTENHSFAESISERLNSEIFIERINQFPPEKRDTVIGAVVEYLIIHPDGFALETCIDKLLSMVDKLNDMGNDDLMTEIYIDSVAKKNGLSEPFSQEDERLIYEYISRKLHKDGYLYHAFNGCFEKSILEHGLNGNKTPWDQSELDEIAYIGTKHGKPMLLGWHEIQQKQSVYFNSHPYEIYRFGNASPEWFAQFTAEGFHIPVEGNRKSAFYRKDYAAARKNIIDMCSEMKSRSQEDIDAHKAYPNISEEDEEKILNFFEKYWAIFCGPDSKPKVALIKRSALVNTDMDTYEEARDSDLKFHERYHKYDTYVQPSLNKIICRLLYLDKINNEKTDRIVPRESFEIVTLPDYKYIHPEEYVEKRV